MKKLTQKLLSLAIAIVMILGSFVITKSSQNDIPSDNSNIANDNSNDGQSEHTDCDDPEGEILV